MPSAKTTLAENKAIMKISSSGNLLSPEEQVSKFETYKNLTGEIKQLGKLKVMKTNWYKVGKSSINEHDDEVARICINRAQKQYGTSKQSAVSKFGVSKKYDFSQKRGSLNSLQPRSSKMSHRELMITPSALTKENKAKKQINVLYPKKAKQPKYKIDSGRGLSKLGF